LRYKEKAVNIMKKVYAIKDIDSVVEEVFLPKLKKYTIFTFQGPLGAGKTTLIKRVLAKSGVKEIVTSPTFNYLNKYHGNFGMIFNHFDLYRITSLDGFLELGFDEYLYQNKVINLIEWPLVIEDLLDSEDLKSKVCNIKLSYDPKNLSIRVLETK